LQSPPLVFFTLAPRNQSRDVAVVVALEVVGHLYILYWRIIKDHVEESNGVTTKRKDLAVTLVLTQTDFA